ncbi:MAG: 4Fe-4S dicluster domain-containing protein [Firmicutes bacterium]|nr:4Fe-4S dicluster domain-containing protein [Bacillota bacterium]
MAKEVLIRFDRCLGCRSCELACAVAHSESKTLFGALGEARSPLKRIFVDQAGVRKVPVNCRHCEEAPCLDACIAGAMRRTPDGAVTNEGGERRCAGCWMCVMVCPYGVIRSELKERVAVKCDRNCLDDSGVPACVRSCPTGALVYGRVDDFGADKRKEFLAVALGKI